VKLQSLSLLSALGGSIEVPTIEKKMVSINIPQGMQSGHKLRVKG